MEGEFYSMLTTQSNCVSSLPGSRVTLQVLPLCPLNTHRTWSLVTGVSAIIRIMFSFFLLVISAPIGSQEEISEGISGAIFI